MHIRNLSLMMASAAAFLSAQPAFGQNQSSSFPDSPANHWAYQAIQDLAARGLVKGFQDVKMLAVKDLSRFEFASILNRVLETLDDMVLRRGGAATPKLSVLTQDTLNEIQALKDAFQDQLQAIQSDVKKAQEDIDALRSDVEDAKTFANKAFKQADNSYGAGSGRKFSIGGYIQTRYIGATSADSTLFPGGAAASSSGYNGNYMVGGNRDSFLVRRSRLKVTGAITANTKYGVQIDASGLTSGSNQAMTVREGNVTYTPGDGSTNNPAFTVGLFANPFGYALPTSSSTIVWAERPLAFNENSEGIFAGQDYDRGFQVYYGPGQMKYTAAFVNGSGRGSNDTDRRIDAILRAAYASKDGTFGAGASYYDGDISFSGTPPITLRKKQLVGIDAQYTSPAGPFVMAEYISGTFEQRTWMDVPTLKLTTQAAAGNKIAGYYVIAGYTFDKTKPHPWTLAASFDVLQRSKSGAADSGSWWDDENFGIGALYNLDAATRLKLWFTNPSRVAHPSAQPSPKKVGLITTELQVKF